jgi:beta-lactam-binding protein with PASTA domain
LTARSRPQPWAWWSLRGVVVLGVAALLTAALAFAARGWGTDRTHVPYVIGTTERVAVTRVERHGLRAEVVHDRRARRTLSSKYAGEVVYQTWNRGVQLPRGSTLRLTVYPARR